MNDENQTNGNEETLLPQDTEAELEIDLSSDEDEEEIDWEAKSRKSDELANNYKIRAEKAEKLAKQAKPQTNSNTSGFSTLDIIALSKSDINDEDYEAVTKFAKMEGITVRDALKNDELKAILGVRNEKRTVAQASHSGANRRSTTKISDDSLVNKASKGELPESDDDIRRLNELRWGKKGN